MGSLKLKELHRFFYPWPFRKPNLTIIVTQASGLGRLGIRLSRSDGRTANMPVQPCVRDTQERRGEGWARTW